MRLSDGHAFVRQHMHRLGHVLHERRLQRWSAMWRTGRLVRLSRCDVFVRRRVYLLEHVLRLAEQLLAADERQRDVRVERRRMLGELHEWLRRVRQRMRPVLQRLRLQQPTAQRVRQVRSERLLVPVQ